MLFCCCFQNWIGSEAVKRKRKAGILPRPKIEITGVSVNSPNQSLDSHNSFAKSSLWEFYFLFVWADFLDC